METRRRTTRRGTDVDFILRQDDHLESQVPDGSWFDLVLNLVRIQADTTTIFGCGWYQVRRCMVILNDSMNKEKIRRTIMKIRKIKKRYVKPTEYVYFQVTASLNI